jgi:hypothetical protein
MEATGYSRWFERLLTELGFGLWVGDPTEIKGQADQETKDRPQRCATATQADAEDNFPQI